MNKKTLLLILNRACDRKRRVFMREQLDALGIKADFFPAIETTALPYLIDTECPSHEGSKLSEHQLSCLLSHQRMWQLFLSTDCDQCFVLEDDVILDHRFADLLSDLSMPMGKYAIWKFETQLTSCLIDRSAEHQWQTFALHRLHSNHCGTAAYSLNRLTAEWLWTLRQRFLDCIDIELFDPRHRSIPAAPVYQCIPAPCVQDLVLSDARQEVPSLKTTIEASLHHPRGNRMKQSLREVMNVCLSIPLRKMNLERKVIPGPLESAILSHK